MMGDAKAYTQAGFTIIEICIVLVIVALLMTLAVFSFTGAKVDLQRQAVAREFKIYLERSRFDSVKRRAAVTGDQANIILNGPSSFTANVDFDGDGVLRAGEARLVDFTQRSGTRIVVSDTGLSYPVTIRFNQRGQVSVIDSLGVPVSPVAFTICSGGDCSPSSRNKTVITVSPSGTVAMFRDGQVPPAPPAPTISNVTPTLNCYVLITNANTTCSL